MTEACNVLRSQGIETFYRHFGLVHVLVHGIGERGSRELLLQCGETKSHTFYFFQRPVI